MLSPIPALSYNFAAFVLASDRTEAVLKIGVPNPELRTEIEALRAFQGRPVVELLAWDHELGALLLRRVRPGTDLSQMEDDEDATRIAAQLISGVPTWKPCEHAFPTLRDWADAFPRLRARHEGGTGPLPAQLVEKAERLFVTLQEDSPPEMLLHGDLHHENVLWDRDRGWVVIDPKGVIGDPTYEAAWLQHNPIPSFLAMVDPRATALTRSEILASTLAEDQARLLAWAFFDAVVSTCWSLEDGTDWRYGLACAELLNELA
jgi:streptomycin 6-kinase